MPITMTVIGTVARLLSGASMAPTMPPVATNIVLVLPASACAVASTRTLRRARRSLCGKSIEPVVEDTGITFQESGAYSIPLRTSEVAEGGLAEAQRPSVGDKARRPLARNHLTDFRCDNAGVAGGSDKFGAARCRNGADDLIVITAGQDGFDQCRLRSRSRS